MNLDTTWILSIKFKVGSISQTYISLSINSLRLPVSLVGSVEGG